MSAPAAPAMQPVSRGRTQSGVIRRAPDALQLPVPGGGLSPEAASRAYGFPHPRAYNIQLDLMRALFHTFEQAHVGIFESPTGTGKSLSLACASLTWLEHNMQRSARGVLLSSASDHQAAAGEALDDDVPDWVTAHALKRERSLASESERALSERIQHARQKEHQLAQVSSAANSSSRPTQSRRLALEGHASALRTLSTHSGAASRASRKHVRPRGHDLDPGDDGSVGEEQFLLTEGDAKSGLRGTGAELAAFLGSGSTDEQPDDEEGLTPELRDLMKTYESGGMSSHGRGALHASLTRGNSLGPGGPAGMGVGAGGSRAEQELEDLLSQETSPQVVFASRTHSQLAQFASEVRKTRFAKHGLRVQPIQRDPDAANPRLNIQLDETGDTEGLPPDKNPAQGWVWETIPLRTISLGSRAQLCINDSVCATGAAKGTEAMNEKCREMLTAPSSSATRDSQKRPRTGHPDQSTPAGKAPPESCSTTSVAAENTRCPFAPPATAEGLERTLLFRSHAFAQVRDIEDLASLGRQLGVCPYFASRAAARTAHVVSAPYNLLLSASPDDGVGSGGGSLKLKDNVVLIDEAHNLVDTVLGQYTLSLTLADAQTALHATQAYLARFSTRLRGDNEVQIRRLVAALTSMVAALRDWALRTTSYLGKAGASQPTSLTDPNLKNSMPMSPNSPTEAVPTPASRLSSGLTSRPLFPAGTRFRPKEAVLTAGQFVAQMGSTGDLINLAALSRFLHESRLLRKLSGYADAATRRTARAQAARGETPAPQRSSLPILHTLAGFLQSLARSDGDGRVLLRVQPATPIEGSDPDTALSQSVHIKYQLLDAGKAFAPVVRAARAVALAGGTMSPFEPVVAQLFPAIATESVNTMSCGHIIPAENALTTIVSEGPTGKRLELTYERRSDARMTDELGALLLNVSSVVPAGMVVFVPSYAVLAAYKTRWQASGLLGKLSERKSLFYEPNSSADVESLLSDYAGAVHAPPVGRRRGALLFAVVGGKLSEGINFANDLARAVVMLGLPFPYAGSVELQERMRFARETDTSSGTNLSGQVEGGKDAGKELYMNMCMRAVNQSIGRAIRHANDHAALILVDVRYGRKDILSRLPSWIASDSADPSGSVRGKGSYGLRKPNSFPDVLKDLVKFFMVHKSKKQP